MNPGETCSSLSSKTTIYGITLNIGPYRMVDSKRWSKWTNDDQKRHLISLFFGELRNETPDIDKIDDSQFIFELTEKKNIHMHAYLTCDQITDAGLDRIQANVNKLYKYPKDEINKVFDWTKTYLDRCFWDAYMQKHQPKPHKVLPYDYIPTKSMLF